MFNELNIPNSNHGLVGYDLPKSIDNSKSRKTYSHVAYSKQYNRPATAAEARFLANNKLRII